MSKTETQIERHYAQSELYEKILGALGQAGVAESDITPETLKPIDEFHIGGIAATKALLDPLALTSQTRVLDLGCGIGGTARFIEDHYGSNVEGIDLTPDFVACAQALTKLVGMNAAFRTGNVTALPYADDSFDVATLIHVGMNLPDKEKLFLEAARVLKDGGVIAVFDVMLFGNQPTFPVPWASMPEDSFLQQPQDYEQAAKHAGFTLEHHRDRGAFAKEFFTNMKAKIAQAGPPPISLPMLMGETAPAKMANMIGAVQAGDIQPVEMIFRKG